MTECTPDERSHAINSMNKKDVTYDEDERKETETITNAQALIMIEILRILTSSCY